MIAMASAKRKLQIASWNIAAINNNPFEYWITYDENENYEKIMSDIEAFLEQPGEKDVPVSEVFTEEMFSELEKRMSGVGWESVRSYYESDFMKRKIVSGFMKVRGQLFIIFMSPLHQHGKLMCVFIHLIRTPYWEASA